MKNIDESKHSGDIPESLKSPLTTQQYRYTPWNRNPKVLLYSMFAGFVVSDILVNQIPGAFDYLSKALLIDSPVGLYILAGIFGALVALCVAHTIKEIYNSCIESKTKIKIWV